MVLAGKPVNFEESSVRLASYGYAKRSVRRYGGRPAIPGKIVLSNDLTREKQIEIAIHEMLHVLDWSLAEEVVTKIARLIKWRLVLCNDATVEQAAADKLREQLQHKTEVQVMRMAKALVHGLAAMEIVTSKRQLGYIRRSARMALISEFAQRQNAMAAPTLCCGCDQLYRRQAEATIGRSGKPPTGRIVDPGVRSHGWPYLFSRAYAPRKHDLHSFNARLAM